MKKHNGSIMIQWLVILGDFALLNTIMLFLIKNHYLPDFLHESKRMLFFISNTSMAIAQLLFYTIIHSRYLSFQQFFERVLKLTVTQSLLASLFFWIIFGKWEGFHSFFNYTFLLFFSTLFVRILERFILRTYRHQGGNVHSVVFVGSDPANLTSYYELYNSPSTGYRILGYYSNDTIKNCPAEFVKLGSLAQLNELIQKASPGEKRPMDEIFCCLSHDDSAQIKLIMDYCDKHVIRFYYVPRMLGNYELNLFPDRIGNLYLYTNHQEPLTDPVNKFAKRLFDVIMAFIVCIAMLPLIPIIALIIYKQSPGPIFFSQDRTGLNGKNFHCYKFRSMHVNNDADKIQATKNDPRKFPFGNFMRKTNIDELPQFFNVLIGNMSIVGPRPHMIHHTEIYSKLIDKYMVRHFSKPGITGWAQVTGFRGETKELWQMEERIRRDIWYIENWSFSLDLRIIFMTAKSLIIPDKKAY